MISVFKDKLNVRTLSLSLKTLIMFDDIKRNLNVKYCAYIVHISIYCASLIYSIWVTSYGKIKAANST